MADEAGRGKTDWGLVKDEQARLTAEAEADLAAATMPDQRVDRMLALADRLRVHDGERTAALLRQARDLARENGYRAGEAYSLAELARHALSVSDLDGVTRLCFEALELLKGNASAAALTNTYLQLGWMCDYLGDYSAAMDWGQKGLSVPGVADTPVLRARLLDLVACIHSQMDDHPAAKQVHAEAVAVIEATPDLYTRASILNNQAMTLVYAGDYESALETGQRSLALGRALDMRRLVYNYADTVGEILIEMGLAGQAEEVLNEALRMTISQPWDISHCYVLKNLARVCIESGNLEAAERHLDKAISTLERLNLRAELALCHQLMATTLERQGDFPGALSHFKTFYTLREATAGKESARRLATLKTTYEIQLAQRDAEIERLRNAELQAEIEERKQVQIALEKLATTDMLTGLFNRHHFFFLAEREVERSMRYQHALSMLMVDIDHFKQVNDTLGHIAGDQVLMAIGDTIRSALREIDIAGRYGGEEFAILLPETQLDNALRVSERLRLALSGLAIETDAGRVSVTASIGLTEMTLHDNGRPAARALAELLDRADRALYKAKDSGRNAEYVYQD